MLHVLGFCQEFDLGVPLAAVMFEAQYDDFVPEVHARIGFTPPPKQYATVCKFAVAAAPAPTLD